MRRFFYSTTSNSVELNSLDAEPPYLSKLSTLSMGSDLVLTESITHHWCRVLRANIGDQGVLFDGFGGEYLVQLKAISKKQATVTLLAHTSDDRTAPIISKIGLVMSRGERMDYAIQKATELGVTAIQLLSSHHGEVTLKPTQVDKKLAHWQQIAIAACEQCGLNRPPLVLAPLSVDEWLERSDDESLSAANKNKMAVSSMVSVLSQDLYYHRLTQQADLRLQMSVPAADQPTMPARLTKILTQELPYIELLIGPEGGLSIEERAKAEQAGFEPWQIGKRVLRTETAPVVALATLHALL